MLGAIAGDIIGSRFEWAPHKSREFELFHPECRFTDDTVHTVAIADALLNARPVADSLREWSRRYPAAGYGERFRSWLRASDPTPYHSFGNGSAMRVSPVAWWHDDLPAVLAAARESALPTHDHPEGVRGAQATAAAVFLARSGATRETIRREIGARFGYDLSRSLAAIRPGYRFDVSCQGSVPEALTAFLEGEDYAGVVRNAVSLGGDSDTLACIAGSVAEAFFGGVPEQIARSAWLHLAPPLRQVLRAFYGRIKQPPATLAGFPD